MTTRTVSWSILAGVLVGLLLVLAWAMVGPTRGISPTGSTYASNGQRIYFSGTSNRGTPITMSMGHMPMEGMMACADCHGLDGHGGRVSMMMGSFDVPDIRYKVLTRQATEPTGELATEPVYDDAGLGRAITQGIDPAGQLLKFPMPQWQMSDADLADLIGYLKALP